MTDYNILLDQLKNGEITELQIPKEDFLQFRSILVERTDFKHFIGTAHHLGRTVYVYSEKPSI